MCINVGLYATQKDNDNQGLASFIKFSNVPHKKNVLEYARVSDI